MINIEAMAFSTAYVVLALVALAVGKAVRRLAGGACLDRELTHNDNVAQGVATIGYYAAVLTVFIGATYGESLAMSREELLLALALDMAWAVGGILLINLGHLTIDRVLLRHFSVKDEIVRDRNVGTGAVVAGSYLATGFVLAGAIIGEGGGIATALPYFLLGQLALVLFGEVYQRLVGYDLHGEIERDNAPAGVAFGANLAALGLILFGAASQEVPLAQDDSIDWWTLLLSFGGFAVFSGVLLLILRQAADWILLPNATLREEIVRDRNLNAAFVEAFVVIGMGAVIVVMF